MSDAGVAGQEEPGATDERGEVVQVEPAAEVGDLRVGAGHRPAGVALGRRTRHDDRPSLLGDAARHSRPPVRGPAPGAGRSARMDHERRVGQAGERGAGAGLGWVQTEVNGRAVATGRGDQAAPPVDLVLISLPLGAIDESRRSAMECDQLPAPAAPARGGSAAPCRAG